MSNKEEQFDMKSVQENVSHIKEGIQELLNKKEELENNLLSIEAQVSVLVEKHKLHEKVNKYEVEFLQIKLADITEKLSLVNKNIHDYFEKTNEDENKLENTELAA